MDQDTIFFDGEPRARALRIECDDGRGYRFSIISPSRVAEYPLDAAGSERLVDWLDIEGCKRRTRLAAEVDRLTDLVQEVAKRGGVMLAHRYEDGKERLFLPETDAEKQAEGGMEQTFKRQVEEAAEVLRKAGYKGGRTLAEQVGDAVLEAKRAKAELQGVNEALDRGQVPHGGSAEDRVIWLVQEHGDVKNADVGRLTGLVHRSWVDSLSRDREKAVKSEERTRERMAALGDEFNALQKRYHEANEMRMALASAAQDLASAMGFSDGMELTDVIRIACDRQADITKAYGHIQKIGEALSLPAGTKQVDVLPIALAHLGTLNEYEKGLRLEGYSPDLDGLSSMRGDALRGRALGRLVAQIQRLRENHCHSMGFGIGATDVAAAVKAEVDEVLAEESGSEAAQRETAGVLAVACHLVMVHGSSLYEAMADEEERLRHRLDWVEHGKTWAEAKELVSAGSFVATPATRFAGEFGDGEPAKMVNKAKVANAIKRQRAGARSTMEPVPDNEEDHKNEVSRWSRWLKSRAEAHERTDKKEEIAVVHGLLGSDLSPSASIPKAEDDVGPTSFAGGETVTLADGMVTEDHLTRPGRWALVEAMGHAQYVGFARDTDHGLEVDCIDDGGTRRKLFGPQAIFAVTDLADEAEARLVASNLARKWRTTDVIDPDLLKKPEPTEREPAPDGWVWDGDELRHEEVGVRPWDL